jgi:hypothetical protein
VADPLGAESPDPAPDEEDSAESGEDRPAVDDDARDEKEGAENGANGWSVVASEEKQHGWVPFWL